jgi:hypothetical protein
MGVQKYSKREIRIGFNDEKTYRMVVYARDERV